MEEKQCPERFHRTPFGTHVKFYLNNAKISIRINTVYVLLFSSDTNYHRGALLWSYKNEKNGDTFKFKRADKKKNQNKQKRKGEQSSSTAADGASQWAGDF